MKKLSILSLLPAIALTIGGILSSSLGWAQTTEGVVTYTETIKMKIEVPEGMNEEEFRKMVPSEQKASKTLVFNAKECLYSDAPDQAPGGTDAVINSQDPDGGEPGDRQEVRAFRAAPPLAAVTEGRVGRQSGRTDDPGREQGDEHRPDRERERGH